MTSQSALDVDSPAVQSHLSLLHGVIARMASNSASCKTWCVGLVSALTVVVAESGNNSLLVVVVLPIVLFGILDAYYLGIERRFRSSYEQFVRKLHSGTAQVDDAFVINARTTFSGHVGSLLGAFVSFSVWPFYLGLSALLWVVGKRLLGAS